MGVEMLPTAGPSLPAPPPVFSLYHIPPTLSAFTVDYLSKLFSAVPKPSAMLKLPDRPVDSRKFPEFRYFIRTLLINGRISADTLVHALIYLSRFHRKVSRQRALVEEGAKHKLFLAALLVASKFCDDRWPLATIVVCDFLPQGLLSCSEVNRMERAFLRIIGYKLVVDPDELALLLNKHGIDIREIARIIHQRLGKAGMRVPPVPPPRVSPPAQSLVPMLPPPMPSRAKSAGLISSVLAGRPGQVLHTALLDVPLERQQEIATVVRGYRKDGVTVPWFDLAHRFRLSQSDMEQIVALDDDRLQKRREQSVRVTQLADQAFDSQRGRCDWDSVVKKLDVPLMECLGRFDASLSSVPVRSLPKFVDWLPDDFPLLKDFLKEFPGTLTSDEWRLVSAFMNAKQANCAMAYSMCIRPRMTTELSELITNYREKVMLWKDIHQQLPVFASVQSLRHAYSQFKVKTSRGPKPATIRVRWTDAETARVHEIIRLYYSHGGKYNCLRVAESKFPGRSQQSIESKIETTLRRQWRITVADMKRVKTLVDKHDSTEETTVSSLFWNSDDEARLLHLATLYDPRAIDWATIAGDLGRTVIACKLKYNKLHKQREPKRVAEYADAVSHAVKKQYTQHQSVDWARVSESVGLSERECLEANQFGDGKARWIYDPDTFSWDMANRMTAFIEMNYPRPLPVNYTAVSNYMWIEPDDCVKMAGLLRGEMTWTEDAVAKVVELRGQGMMYKDIARQLSPNLAANKVVYAYLLMRLHTLPTKLGCKLRM
ncbi:PHO85 cyclin-1 [Coemansia sp. RSA 2705]|nr:PHO85 cyclin-1 [Coemansia sp. RSA 2705]